MLVIQPKVALKKSPLSANWSVRLARALSGLSSRGKEDEGAGRGRLMDEIYA
jgi:hypothetical protein